MQELLLKQNKNYILLGEAGSGKSELSVNMAVFLSENGENVRLFDLDQSKPVFRTRDIEDLLQEKQIELNYGKQFWDTPVVSAKVATGLKDKNSTAILDVGGGENAARVIGSFRNVIEATNTEILYIINPYRPYSSSLEDIAQTMQTILTHCRQENYSIVINPNLGYATTAPELIAGYNKAKNLLPEDTKIKFTCVFRELLSQSKAVIKEPIFPMDLYFKYIWSQNDS